MTDAHHKRQTRRKKFTRQGWSLEFTLYQVLMLRVRYFPVYCNDTDIRLRPKLIL
jgi:hypothetical protein